MELKRLKKRFEDKTLTTQHKKNIVNQVIGMMGKKYNKKKSIQSFKNYDDALRMKRKTWRYCYRKRTG